MKSFKSVISNIIFAVLITGIAGGIERLLWINQDAQSHGFAPVSWVQSNFEVDFGGICQFNQASHVEFKMLQSNAIQFRCSWFGGSGTTWWPFYTEINTRPLEQNNVIKDFAIQN